MATNSIPETVEEPTYNATMDLLEGNLAAGRGSRPYLVTEDRTWSYEEVAEATHAASVGLLDMGLKWGDRILLATRDSPDFVLAFWAAIRAGLVPVPVAQGLSVSDLNFILADSEARAALCDESSAVSLSKAAEGTDARLIFAGDSPRAGMTLWADIRAERGGVPPASTTEDDVALWLYTSGTTGLPKAVMHRHKTLGAAPGALSRQVVGMEADDVVLSVSRMFFAYGLGNSVYLPAAVGASVVINDGPVLPARVAELVEEHRPTVVFGVPAFFDGFTRLKEFKLPSSVRVVVSAGEALSVQLFERFQSKFGLPLLDGLGSTEALHHVTSNRPDDVVAGSAGRALDGYVAEVRDRDGQPLPEGERGELWVKGPTTFIGYWRRPELTARVREGEWVRTGDQVRMLDGRLFHEGRLDDLIKLGGVWVAPMEIEDVLRGHKDVTDVAVVAVDEGAGVPLLKAFVRSERSDAALRRELISLCRGRLATFKVPQSFEVVPELPRTPTGKLKRFVLREQGDETRS